MDGINISDWEVGWGSITGMMRVNRLKGFDGLAVDCLYLTAV